MKVHFGENVNEKEATVAITLKSAMVFTVSRSLLVPVAKYGTISCFFLFFLNVSTHFGIMASKNNITNHQERDPNSLHLFHLKPDPDRKKKKHVLKVQQN